MSEYVLDMEISPQDLDVEWLEQPKLMMKYTKKLAELREKRDLIKEELDLTKAELDREIRESPADFKLEKINNDVVANTILTVEDYQKGSRKLIRANYEVNVMMGIVQAVEQRKQALENLVRLHGQQYFAGPTVPRDLKEEMENRHKSVNKGIAQKLTRRKT